MGSKQQQQNWSLLKKLWYKQKAFSLESGLENAIYKDICVIIVTNIVMTKGHFLLLNTLLSKKRKR